MRRCLSYQFLWVMDWRSDERNRTILQDERDTAGYV